MGLKTDLDMTVAGIFRDAWNIRDGLTVPESEDIQLGNHGVKLEAAILYADLASSTKLVDSENPTFSAECYKAFLHCASKIIRNRGGQIRSFDGDRVMGIFIDDRKNSNAARCGLEINWAVANIVNPAIASQYQAKQYRMVHKVGIDCSSILVAVQAFEARTIWSGLEAPLITPRSCAPLTMLAIRPSRSASTSGFPTTRSCTGGSICGSAEHGMARPSIDLIIRGRSINFQRMRWNCQRNDQPSGKASPYIPDDLAELRHPGRGGVGLPSAPLPSVDA